MEQAEFVMPTPGSLFREKRRKLGWGLQDVADELLLSVAQVEAIEQDDFKSLPETPYIIGYWRSYANLLGIDISEEIDSYKESRNTPQSNIVLKPNHRSAHHLQEKLRKKSALVFFILSVLFLGVIWYWQTPKNILVTQWSDINSDPQLVIIDSEDNTEQGIAEDNNQFDTQNISVIVLPEPNFSEGLSVGDEQESDHSDPNLPENPVPQAEQQSPDDSEQVLGNNVENTNHGPISLEVISSNPDSAGQPNDQNLLSHTQAESQNPILSAEVTVSSAGQAETVAPGPEKMVTEVAATPPKVVEEPIQFDTEVETVETGQQAASRESGYVITELTATPPKVVEEPIQFDTEVETVETGQQAASRESGYVITELTAMPPNVAEESTQVDTAGEIVETEEQEASLESSIGTVIDPTSKNQIVIHVEKRMWLDVREQDGTKLLFRYVQSGEPLIINGKPPFWVYLGEADSASVVYLGQMVQFETNKDEQFVQIVVGEFPQRRTTGPVAESNE